MDFGCVSCKKSQLSKKNIKARLEWAEKHVLCSYERWFSIIWSDESKINLHGSDNKR